MTKNPLPGPIKRLREIAAKVKEWEDRDIRENSMSSRLLYHVDLEELAMMFQGSHPRYRAEAAPKGAWLTTAANVVRDLEIAKFMTHAERQANFNYDEAIEQAAKVFGVGEKLAAAADTKYRKLIRQKSPEDVETILMGEVFAAAKLGKIRRGAGSKKGDKTIR